MANKKKLVGFGVAALVFLILVLSYFNIIPLSKYFSFLPHKNISSNLQPLNKKILFVCPAPLRPCEGQTIFKNRQFAGIGFKVPNTAPIFAAISGDLIYRDENATQSSIHDTAIIVGKSDKTKGYTAVYNYIGAKIGDKLIRYVFEKDTVAIATSGSYLKDPNYKGINLIFRIYDNKGRVIPLSPSDFQ